MSRRKEIVQTTRNKALLINQDGGFYGSFAEIGAGQEVARHFFQAGLASQTVAKSMSAYDKVFSDSIYGKGSRFVSEDRLLKMLDHECNLLNDRLKERKKETRFFAFANTVATSSHEDEPSCHGWMGIRFQIKPEAKFNDIILHVRMKDRLRLQQQDALGILGVNLLYGARYLIDKGHEFIKSLLDNIGEDRIEIEFIRFDGPALSHIDNRLMSLELVQQNMTQAVMFAPDGRPLCPSDCLFKKSILLQRGTFRPVTNTNMTILENGLSHLRSDSGAKKDDIISFMEVNMTGLRKGGAVDQQDFLNRVDTIGAVGRHVLVSNFSLYSDLKAHLRNMTSSHIGIVLGASALEGLFDPHYYGHKKGGILEAFGQLFDDKTRIYVFPFKTGEACMTAKTFRPKTKLADLYQYCMRNDFIVEMENCDDIDTSIHSETVRKLMAKNDKDWEKLVPRPVRDLIKKKKMFL